MTGSPRTLAKRKANRLSFQSLESAIISPDPESGATFFLRRENLRKSSMKQQLSPCHPSQDCALNHLPRLESVPDSGCSRKGGYCAAVLHGMSEQSEQETKTK